MNRIFSLAVNKGRALSEADPKSYFVDDENSETLFLGYTVGGYRMKNQLNQNGITVDKEHPLLFICLVVSVALLVGLHLVLNKLLVIMFIASLQNLLKCQVC